MRMNQNQNETTFLTSGQFTSLLISALGGVGTLYVPSIAVQSAKQDGWICCIIGTLYPLYLLIVANYMSKRFPKDNILVLSKRCFGRFLGSILNIIFILFFLFIITSELSGLVNVLEVYAANFLKHYQMFLSILIPIAYIVFQGIRPTAKLCEMVLYTNLMLVFVPMGTLKYGNILNAMPVFGSGAVDIIKGSKEMSFFYTGMEIIFLIYPYFKERQKLFKCGIVSIIFISSIYTVDTFLSIYYLGIETSVKYLWPVVTLSDAVRIPIITSFRYLFLALFILVVFRCLSSYYFATSYGFSQIINKISFKTIVIMLYPIIIFISLFYGNPTTRREYTDKLINAYVIFNLLYISAVAILINFKKGDKIEKI